MWFVALPPGPDQTLGPAVTAWSTIINDRTVEVICAARNNIYILTATDAFEPVLGSTQMATYLSVAVSPNSKLLALFSVTGKIWVVSADFHVRSCRCAHVTCVGVHM